MGQITWVAPRASCRQLQPTQVILPLGLISNWPFFWMAPSLRRVATKRILLFPFLIPQTCPEGTVTWIGEQIVVGGSSGLLEPPSLVVSFEEPLSGAASFELCSPDS